MRLQTSSSGGGSLEYGEEDQYGQNGYSEVPVQRQPMARDEGEVGPHNGADHTPGCAISARGTRTKLVCTAKMKREYAAKIVFLFDK